LALFVIGVFGLLLIYSKELERVVRDNVKVEVYLKNQISETQRLQIEKNLSSRSFLPKQSSVKPIQFVSKEEAAKRVIRENLGRTSESCWEKPSAGCLSRAGRSGLPGYYQHG